MHAWQVHVDAVAACLGSLFARSETRQRALAYVKGLLSTAARKNGWQLAESNGDRTPDGIPYLLLQARWSPDALRAALWPYVMAHLGAPQVRIVEETGFLKKGTHAAGVVRLYCGTVGRIANCQIGVFVAYASARGCTQVDRALYLPRA